MHTQWLLEINCEQLRGCPLERTKRKGYQLKRKWVEERKWNSFFWLRNHAAYMAERNWGRINSTSCKYLCIVLIVLIREHVLWQVLKPLALMGDQERISPYNINTISTRQLLRIKENINLRIIRWSITKFSKLT